MLRILESQAPAKQTATDTINTLSSRLSSATLLEDRRAAILGLRSFAKQYPASVASGALRDLTAALRKDGEDSDTIKVVLETLLMLFEPDEQSPEAAEEITLWLADEFTQRQDNITALLDLLETGEFYLRLYSLQILSHVSAARPQRAHEVVLAAPLGVSRITAVLDDRREAARNEALLLLVALTPTNAELQKVVAFENAFDRVFNLIDLEGGLTHGSTVVRDCLSLLANLLTLNTSNQSYFREIGCIMKVSKLLADVLKEEESPDGVSDWVRSQRDVNVWGILRVIQLFLVQGSQGTNLSQLAFWQSRVLLRILQVASHQSFGTNVRAKSLEVCGDIIRKNAGLQEQFGDLSVPLSRPVPATNGHSSPASDKRSERKGSRHATPAPAEVVNVIEALLQLTLEPASLTLFDVRLAASNCIKAFIEGHNGIRTHVLRRAIDGHKSGDDAIPNILTVLLEPAGTRSNSDPYQVWMASVLMLHILYEDPDTKSIALKVSEGNADDGEEVVTLVQSLASNVVAGVQHIEDERALLGYLMLLCAWLFEDPDAVNDLLNEGSNIQGLAAAAKVASPTMPLVAGLSCLLLGIVYEFSTKDSPIPRNTLYGVLNKNLSREIYIDRLTKLRESPFVRDFEVMPINGEGPLPDVYFDKTFIDFLKDNFSRLLRTIDRDPGLEISFIANGVQKGISRELVDSLRAEVEEQKRLLESAQSEVVQLRQKFEQEEMEHRRTRESTSVELGRIKQINESLHRHHEDELGQIQNDVRQRYEMQTKEHETILAQLRREHLAALEETTSKHLAEKNYLEQRTAGHDRELKRVQDRLTKQHHEEVQRATAEAMQEQQRLRNEISTLQSSLEVLKTQFSKEVEDHQHQIENLEKSHEHQISEAESRTKKASENLSDAETKTSKLESRLKDLQKQHSEGSVSLKAAKDQATNSEAVASEAIKKVSAAESKLKKAEDMAKSFTDKFKASDKKVTTLETDLKSTQAELKSAKDELKKVQADAKNKKTSATEKSSSAEKKALEDAQSKVRALEEELDTTRAQADKAREVQTELDDLLVVFADLEAKREADKKRLKELGEEVSEDEGEDDDDEEDEAEVDDDEDVD